MKSRDTFLDIIRIIACFLVVLMHSPIPSETASGPFLVALGYFTAPCIGLFFMVSGALLIPVKTDYIVFLKKRFGKIVIPTVIWSLFYILLNSYNSESELNIVRAMASIPFSAQGNGVLWFMYTLAGLYLLAPILSAWLEKAKKNEIQLVLLLQGISLCYPIFEFWLSINRSDTGILYYFTGYAGYFLLGYFMKHYPQSLSCFMLWAIALSGVVLIGVLKYYGIKFDFYRLFWYLSIFVVSLCGAIWKSVKWISETYWINKLSGGFLVNLSNLSFGVYLVHIFFMRDILWKWDIILTINNYPLQCIVTMLLTLAMSFGFCYLLSYLPKSEWIIGYHMNKRA